jgi:hypothetical protein
MWNKNKDIIKWVITLVGSGLIAYGVVKTKISQMETDISVLKSEKDKVVSLQIELAKVQTELKDFKEDNKQEHRTFKRKEQ